MMAPDEAPLHACEARIPVGVHREVQGGLVPDTRPCGALATQSAFEERSGRTMWFCDPHRRAVLRMTQERRIEQRDAL